MAKIVSSAPLKKIAKKSPAKKAVPKKTAPKKTAPKSAPDIISDDHIDLVAFDLKYNANIAPAKTKVKIGLMGDMAETCPQGKQPRVIRDNPQLSPPVNTAQYIVQLKVTLSAQNLEITWLDGKVQNLLCSPNPTLTPRGNDLVGFKCGSKHTNYKKDGMAWFTALKSRGMAYGFHNSQRVGLGIVSHGCIRVNCADAKMINQNSWSGKTKIKIIR